MSSKQSHNIRNRATANDIFITPEKLAISHIKLIPEKYHNCIWLDPCKNSGNYYNNFPNNCIKNYCEILEDKDFFNYTETTQVICGNPPYSILNKWLDKSIQLKPDIISYLISQGALTTRRIENMEKAGYGLINLHLTKVYNWYGMSYIATFEKGKESILSYDRTIWR